MSGVDGTGRDGVNQLSLPNLKSTLSGKDCGNSSVGCGLEICLSDVFFLRLFGKLRFDGVLMVLGVSTSEGVLIGRGAVLMGKEGVECIDGKGGMSGITIGSWKLGVEWVCILLK